MSKPWDEIKEVIERTENDRAMKELASLEYEEGYVIEQHTLTERTRVYLEFLGEMLVGIGIGVFSLVFNFILFVWILHLEF